MDATVIKAIADIVHRSADPREIDGRTYCPTASGWNLVTDPQPAAIRVSSLNGLVSLYEESLISADNSFVRVHSPTEVLSEAVEMDRFQRRDVFAIAECDKVIPAPMVGVWSGLDTFLIQIQSRFVDNEDKAYVLKLLGNIRDQAVQTQSDDGVTQTVSSKVGIVLEEKAAIKNPVTLAPIRTFPELDQPESPFILRLRKGRSLEACLFEADGGKWRQDAIESIGEYLGDAIKGDVSIVG